METLQWRLSESILYGITKCTVLSVKNKVKIVAFKCEMADNGMVLKAKMVQLGDNGELAMAVY